MTPPVDVHRLIACPQCRTPLDRNDDAIRCSACGHEWPLLEGTPDFLGDSPYWGEIPQEIMQQVVDRARAGDWRNAASWGGDQANHDSFARNLEDPSRADWSEYVELDRSSVVLDVGSGCGNLSQCLSPVVGQVCSLESVRERVLFSNLRWAQEGLTNIQLLRGSILEPPLVPGAFDLVVMNGVLEWVGYSRVRRDPAAVQALALEKIFELLKPGGVLYVGIENRIGNLRSRDHLGLRYTSYMPRWLADWTHRLRGKGTYRVYTHTLSRYKRMFREAGFDSVETYLAVPGYTYPDFLIPAASRDAIQFFLTDLVRAKTLKRRLALRAIGFANRLGLVPHLAQQFAFFARKAAA